MSISFGAGGQTSTGTSSGAQSGAFANKTSSGNSNLVSSSGLGGSILGSDPQS